MLRVVFDTNVVVSALLWGGLPAQALDTVLGELAVMVATEETIAELSLVLSRPKFAKRLTEMETTGTILIEKYHKSVKLVKPADIGAVIKEDPKDDKFLACAVGGKAVLVVSGDHHLLELQKFRDVEIITVLEFLKRVYPQPE